MNPELYSLFNLYWQKAETCDFKPQDGMVFFSLVHWCNRLNWVNPFSLPNKRATLLAGISEKTLRESRTRLQDNGLIRFEEGKRKAASPVYYLPVKDDNGSLYVPTERKTERITECKTDFNGSLYVPTERKTERLNKNKDIRYKTEDKTAVVVEPTLFSEDELKERKRKPKARTLKEPPHIPDIDEVLEYFQRMDAPTRLQDWDASARLFFDTYNADGWINRKSGRPIANWESAANNWIYYREQNEKKSQTNKPSSQNEQTRTNQPVAPSGGIPIRGKVTPSCGLKRRNKGGEN